jgi:hypothetical protein
MPELWSQMSSRRESCGRNCRELPWLCRCGTFAIMWCVCASRSSAPRALNHSRDGWTNSDLHDWDRRRSRWLMSGLSLCCRTRSLCPAADSPTAQQLAAHS